MAAKFVLKKGSTGKFRFNLVATNGQVIATSEAYESKASAIKGIESVKRNAPDAEIDDQTDKWPAALLDACIDLAVPGRPIGPWSRRTGAPELAANVEPYIRSDGTKVWSLMLLERQLRPEAYGRRRGGYLDRRHTRRGDG